VAKKIFINVQNIPSMIESEGLTHKLMAGDLQGPRMNSWKSGAVFITAYCPLMVLPSAINVFPFTVQLGHLQ